MFLNKSSPYEVLSLDSCRNGLIKIDYREDGQGLALGRLATIVEQVTRVARWFVFKPNIPIWVNFGGPWN
jgi:hypothetical protein